MYNIIKNHSLNFGSGKENQTGDYRIISSIERINEFYDVLIFTDSKGSSINNKHSKCFTDFLIDKLEEKRMSYLFVSRPKEFFTQLSATNMLLNRICEMSKNLYYVPPFKITISNENEFSYDAVHFTEIGHRKQFEVIMSKIETLN